jgi:hypothetical protein
MYNIYIYIYTIQGHSVLCDKLRAEVLDLKARLQKSEGARRKLHNLNQELRGKKILLRISLRILFSLRKSVLVLCAN